MLRLYFVIFGILLSACAPKEPPVSTWFSENFALGSPLRDPVGALGHAWQWSDTNHTSQYTKLIYARDPSGDVHNTYGVDGSPCFYTSDTYAGRTYWATFTISGTPGARSLSPANEAGGFTIDADVKLVGSATESAAINIYSSPSFWDYDFRTRVEYSGGNTQLYLEWLEPNGSNFGVTDGSLYYVIGAGHLWRGDNLWHHLRVEVKAGTVTTWTEGAFVSEGNYTGGALTVTADGWVKIYIDESLVHTEENIPLILNFDGQDANESSPGSWETAERLVESNVNRVSLVEADIVSGSAYWDNIIVSGLTTELNWIDIANFIETSVWCSVNTVAMWVTADAWAAQAIPMKLRLFCTTNNTVVGESAEITSTTPVDASFAVTMLNGHGKYKLQVGSEIPNVDLFAIGMISAL